MIRTLALAGLMTAIGASSMARAQPVQTQLAGTTTQASRPAGAAGALGQIESLLVAPRPLDLPEYEAALRERVPLVLQSVAEMARRYPQAKELHQARMIAIAAASQLGRMAKDAQMTAQAEALAKVVLASDAPAETKLYADGHLLLLAVRPVGGSSTQPAPEAEKLILEFAERYAKTPQGPDALEVGMDIADLVGSAETVSKLHQRLVKDFPGSVQARQILRRQGAGADIGKPFEASLTRLDGAPLNLPGDLAGKVVVVDFWATWRLPCIAALPELMDLYAKYKGRGVEFVGISLDTDRRRVEEFVKNVKIGWIITFSGKGLEEDPTARTYAVTAIPSVWVIGRDGKVASDNAEGNLAEMLEKALKGPATAPSGKPLPATAPSGRGGSGP